MTKNQQETTTYGVLRQLCEMQDKIQKIENMLIDLIDRVEVENDAQERQ